MEYSWLKVLEALRRGGRRMSLGELKAGLDSRGFRLSEDELKRGVSKMHELGLLEAELLTTTDGTATLAVDEFSRVGITPAGVRKLTAIVKI